MLVQFGIRGCWLGVGEWVGREMGMLSPKIVEKIKSSRWLNPIGLVVGGLAIYAVTQPVRPLQPVIGAPAYIWPKECPRGDYTSKPDGAIIRCVCADEKYRILDWPRRGLPQGAKGERYYRIGNDAVRLSVPFFGLSAEQCWIRGGVSNFYR
ncbi:RcnB family protein [Novosphingobium sp.]|uniref:RcnB family protein n=1 Tax=Novosphingobium sp. TaxID=1874826 RepID=UPI003451B5BE